MTSAENTVDIAHPDPQLALAPHFASGLVWDTVGADWDAAGVALPRGRMEGSALALGVMGTPAAGVAAAAADAAA
eukprot:6467555-Amphidinium_carterae.4